MINTFFQNQKMLQHKYEVGMKQTIKNLEFNWHEHEIRIDQDSRSAHIYWNRRWHYSFLLASVLETWDLNSYFLMTVEKTQTKSFECYGIDHRGINFWAQTWFRIYWICTN